MVWGTKWLLAAAALTIAAAATAAETITYSYDTLGRVTKVVHSGTTNDGVETSYTYDKVHNRTGKTTTGVGASLLAAPTEPSADAQSGAAVESPQPLDGTAVEPGSPDGQSGGSGR
ncbi:MAG TPA: RHS repeat domain-containing protein [Allosphingosinicella sp.]|jgi:YD repeat-containing protein